MIDVTEQISAVRRHIGTRVLEAGEARVMTVSQSYDTDVDDLWDACTSPTRLPRWFMPVSGDLRVGGKYQFEGNAGGTVERCDPPKSFAATWEFGGQVSWVEVRLSAEPDGRTRFELEHVAHVADDLWDQFGPGATGIGWDLAFIGLARHLSSGSSSSSSEDVKADVWQASPEGIAFMKDSGAKWCEANIAFGTPEDKARAAAERVLAFYTAG